MLACMLSLQIHMYVRLEISSVSTAKVLGASVREKLLFFWRIKTSAFPLRRYLDEIMKSKHNSPENYFSKHAPCPQNIDLTWRENVIIIIITLWRGRY